MWEIVVSGVQRKRSLWVNAQRIVLRLSPRMTSGLSYTYELSSYGMKSYPIVRPKTPSVSTARNRHTPPAIHGVQAPEDAPSPAIRSAVAGPSGGRFFLYLRPLGILCGILFFF